MVVNKQPSLKKKKKILDQLVWAGLNSNLTLCLHAGSDESQRVTGQLTTCAGDCATGQEDKDPWVSSVGSVVLQVSVLQSLMEESTAWGNDFAIFGFCHLIRLYVVSEREISDSTSLCYIFRKNTYNFCFL